MNEITKKSAPQAAKASKPARKLVPRPAVTTEAPAAEASATPSAAPAVATAAATPPAAQPATKARPPRKPTAIEQTVAKHQKVLAEALAKAQAIKYDQPKVMKPAPSKAGKADKPTKAEKPAKVKKVKLVRDSYAMPESEYARIGELKERLIALGAPARKSELLRGGIAALASLNDTELKAIMGRVERIKTGRPKK